MNWLTGGIRSIFNPRPDEPANAASADWIPLHYACLSDDGRVATINGVEYERSDIVDEQYLKGVEHATEQLGSEGIRVEINCRENGSLEIIQRIGGRCFTMLGPDLKLRLGDTGTYRLIAIREDSEVDEVHAQERLDDERP